MNAIRNLCWRTDGAPILVQNKLNTIDSLPRGVDLICSFIEGENNFTNIEEFQITFFLVGSGCCNLRCFKRLRILNHIICCKYSMIN